MLLQRLLFLGIRLGSVSGISGEFVVKKQHSIFCRIARKTVLSIVTALMAC